MFRQAAYRRHSCGQNVDRSICLPVSFQFLFCIWSSIQATPPSLRCSRSFTAPNVSNGCVAKDVDVFWPRSRAQFKMPLPRMPSCCCFCVFDYLVVPFHGRYTDTMIHLFSRLSDEEGWERRDFRGEAACLCRRGEVS